MKITKSIFLLLSFLAFLSTVAYSQGSLSCYCEPLTPGSATDQKATALIPAGTDIHWHTLISTYNEGPYSHSYAEAAVIGAMHSAVRSYDNHGHYYYWPASDDQNRYGVWNDTISQHVIVYCNAQWGPDGGGRALAGADVSW